jgi:hypothetical protein
MSHRTGDVDEYEDDEVGEAPTSSSVAVIDANSAFRLLLILVTVWSFIEGFALFTGALEAISLNTDRMAERIIGGQMLVLAGAFAFLAWRREQFRLLLWLPYAAQLAIIIPVGISIVGGSSDGALLLVISIIFFALLFYFWYHSHPLEHFQEALDEDDDDDGEMEDDEEWPEESPRSREAPASRGVSSAEPPPARDATKRPSKFRRRDP